MVYFQYINLWKETGKTTNLLDGYRFAGKKNWTFQFALYRNRLTMSFTS